MASNNLSPTNIVSVTLQGTPQGLAVPNINTLALISQEVPVWAGTQDYAIYKDPTSVAQDFGSNSKAAAIAEAIFSQTPNPIQTGGYLVIIPRLQNTPVAASVVVQDLAYQAVATGSGGNSITIAYTTGGTAGAEVVGVSGSAISVQIASGVSTAAQIAAAVAASTPAAALVTATVFGVSTNKQTAPTGPTSLAGGTSSGLEPVHTAMIRTANEVYYIGTIVDFIPTAPFTSLPAYIQGQQKIGFFASNVKADCQAGGILANLQSKSQSQCRGIYYNDGVAADTVNFAAGEASRLLSVDFSGSLTAIVANLKQIVGFVADTTLAQTDLNTFQSTGVDCYPAFGQQGLVGQAYLFSGGANQFFDQVYNQMWLQLALQVAGFDYLAQATTKIPQTEGGMDGLKDAYRQVLVQSVRNGVAAPGSWTSPVTFGNPTNLIKAVSAVGYYVYSLPVTEQLTADRLARKAPLIQIALKMAGAIQSSAVIVQVNA